MHGKWKVECYSSPTEIYLKKWEPMKLIQAANPLILQAVILSARWAEWIRLFNLEKLAQHNDCVNNAPRVQHLDVVYPTISYDKIIMEE